MNREVITSVVKTLRACHHNGRLLFYASLVDIKLVRRQTDC